MQDKKRRREVRDKPPCASGWVALIRRFGELIVNSHKIPSSFALVAF